MVGRGATHAPLIEIKASYNFMARYECLVTEGPRKSGVFNYI